MQEIEAKLRAGMTKNGIPQEAQDAIVKFVSSFALYGFPESHSASFALLAYASAYLKVRYLSAFTCALLNCQPMGFYSPATLVKDAPRRGLKIRPVDITRSNWNCTLEREAEEIVLRWVCATCAASGKAWRNRLSPAAMLELLFPLMT